MTDYFLIPLNPPLVVSGRVEVVDESDGERPFDFENGLAIAVSENWLDGEYTADYSYKVVMPNGRVYEVDNTLITSAEPWTPSARPVNNIAALSGGSTPAPSAFSTEVWNELSSNGPMSIKEIRAWAGGDARRRMVTVALRDLQDRGLIVIDGGGRYWATHKGQLLPFVRSAEFTPSTDGDIAREING
ncbi:hypothetical protein ABQE48_22005 [Mycolicibacterium thermoresistibile]